MNVINYILFILFFLIMYSVCFKTVEGFDDDFYYYNKLMEYKTLPNSFVNDSTPSRTVNKFGFYKGKGTLKKEYKEAKSDEKISTLNKLLNRLLGRIVSDNQDCVGSFGKYSECDKSCGSNAFQTRKYNITQERGKNGKDCPFVDGYEEKIRCNLDECQLGDICENNADCETGNCNPNSTRCENMIPCDNDNFHVCNETQCINLNNNNDDKMIEGSYIYNNVDKECFFKTPAEIEKLNLNIYTYDFGEIKEKLKDIVFDCEYYQVKKDDIGPCVNRPNVIIDNGEPKCTPGYGPEPTMFNGDQACKNCIIPEEQKGGSDDECYCKRGGTFDITNYECSTPEIQTNYKICDKDDDGDRYIKYIIGGDDNTETCDICGRGESFKKIGDNVSCIRCTNNRRTLSDYCLRDCQEGRADDSEICINLCGGLTDTELHDGFFNKFKRNIDGVDNIDNLNKNELMDTDYQEQCLDIFESSGDETQSRTCGDGQFRPDSGTCENNCSPGSYWDDRECRRCREHPDCLSSDPNVCVENYGGAILEQDDTGRPIYWNNESTRREIFSTDTYTYVQGCININPEYRDYYEKVGYILKPCYIGGQSGVGRGCRRLCPAGEEYSESGEGEEGECTACKLGYYNSQEDDLCRQCNSGIINAEKTTCTPCDSNSEVQVDNWEQDLVTQEQKRCECAPGYYLNEGVCTPCEPGTYQNLQNQNSCVDCPEGTYQDETGKAYCKVKRNCWRETKYYTSQGSSAVDSECNDTLSISGWCSRGSGDDPPSAGEFFRYAGGTNWELIGDCPSSPTDYLDYDPISGTDAFNCNSRHVNTNVSDGSSFPVSADGGSLHKNQMALPAGGPDIHRSSVGDGLICTYSYGCVESSPVTYCYLKPDDTPSWHQGIKRWYDASPSHSTGSSVTVEDEPTSR